MEHPRVELGVSRARPLERAARGDEGVFASLFARPSGELRDRIAETSETVGLMDSLLVLAGTLSHGQKQWLEIGMLLMHDP